MALATPKKSKAPAKIDLDMLVAEINTLQSVRKIISYKSGLQCMREERGDDITTGEVRDRWTMNSLMAELKLENKNGYTDHIELLKGEYTFLELVQFDTLLERKLNERLKELVVQILKAGPTDIMSLHQLMQQYGVNTFDNLVDTANIVAHVSDEEPSKKKTFVLVGHNGEKYWMTPKNGFGYKNEKPWEWYVHE